MAYDGTPEVATQRLGSEIARLRNQRAWSRSHLVLRLMRMVDENDPLADMISESWLKRLEDGRIVKVSRHMLELLCQALDCTDEERVWLLLCADRNPLASENGPPNRVAMLLNYTIHLLHRDAADLLENILQQYNIDDLSEQDLLAIVHTAIEVMTRQRLHDLQR